MEQDLEQELAFHREMSEANGDSIGLGNASSVKEQAYDMWRFNFVENLGRDIKYAARGLKKDPTLVAGALLSLSLGIGVNTAIFSLGVEFLLSEPSVTDASSLVAIRMGGSSHASPTTIQFLRDSGLFQGVTGENVEAFSNWNDGTETRRVFSVETARNYFTTIGAPVLHGRGYHEGDPNEVAVLSYGFWQRHFNSDPSVVGKSAILDERMCTIVGVLPENFRSLIGFGLAPDVYTPIYLPDKNLQIYARLKPGMGLGEALEGVKAVGARVDEVHPGRWKLASNCEVKPIAGFSRLFQEKMLRSVGAFFFVLLVVVGLVLLIACVNVASLLLARASARQREMAIRLSLGAGRARLMQQLMVESLLLSVSGAALGFALAQVVASLLARVQLPFPVPIRLQIELDWRVATYAALLAIAATVACGLLPAWQTVRESVAPALHRESRFRLRRALVVSQIAVSLVVLATGFLFIRNLMKSSAISPGFDVTKTVSADVYLPAQRYTKSEEIVSYVDRSVQALRAVPGIEAAAGARILPFNDNNSNGATITFAGTGEERRIRFWNNAVTPDYFRAMDIPIYKGRAFTELDRGNAKVVAVNATFVARYLNDREPLGTVFLWGMEGKTPYQVVAVVGDTKTMTIGEDQVAQMYEPLAQTQSTRTRVEFVLRSAIPPAMQLTAVKDALRRVEPNAGMEVATLFSSIGMAFLPSQVGAALLGAIGVLGLLLATVGLYGTLAYSVARRTREIGVRMALGAPKSSISRMVLSEALKLVVIGAAIGTLIAVFVTKPLAMFLVAGLSTSDPVSFVAVVLVFMITALAASLGPVRRALAVDPMTSLRYE